MDEFRKRVEALEEELTDCYQHCGEVEAEYGGECARFGDGSPGQGLAVMKARAAVSEAEKRLKELTGDPRWPLLVQVREAEREALTGEFDELWGPVLTIPEGGIAGVEEVPF